MPSELPVRRVSMLLPHRPCNVLPLRRTVLLPTYEWHPYPRVYWCKTIVLSRLCLALLD